MPIPSLGLPRTWGWIACGALLVALVALVDVQTINPRISVRWSPALDVAQRARLEVRYGLSNGAQDTDDTWRYDLGNRSREHIRALLSDPAVEDTGYINREALTVAEPLVRVRIREVPYPFSDRSTVPRSCCSCTRRRGSCWRARCC